jgi:cytochrome c oxidase assembly protein subunit 15
VFAGGLVTSTGSSLAVPDWPLSYGQFFPPMVGGVAIEHGHRMIAGTVAMLTAVLAVWTWRVERRPAVRRLAAVALGAVVLQALLGGITVLWLLPTAVSVGHAALGQTFFCLVVVLALVTGRDWPRIERGGADGMLRRFAVATSAAIFVQLLLGAVMRHTGAGLAIPDFPLAFGRIVPDLSSSAVAIHFAHRTWALVVAALAAATTVRVLRDHGGEARLVRPAALLVAGLCLQVLLGAVTIWSAKAPLPTTAHVATGAFLLATSIVLTIRVHARFTGIALPRAAIERPLAPERSSA